jgi:hypothetical protein
VNNQHQEEKIDAFAPFLGHCCYYYFYSGAVATRHDGGRKNEIIGAAIQQPKQNTGTGSWVV